MRFLRWAVPLSLWQVVGAETGLSRVEGLTPPPQQPPLVSQLVVLSPPPLGLPLSPNHSNPIGGSTPSLSHATGTSLFQHLSSSAISLVPYSSDDLAAPFISFEEWKRQKVQAEPRAKRTKKPAPPPMAFEDEELTLDMFSKQQIPPKTLFNYASPDCAATVVETNPEARGASSVLREHKDSYLLNPCLAPAQYVVVELCQDIQVENIVVGNFEFFLSTFHRFRVSVSDRHPVTSATGWRGLGEFEAENLRGVQSFKVRNPLIWARYLKLEVLSHYGNEFYCPLSLLRVHGKTMMEEYKFQEEKSPVFNLEIPVDACRVTLPRIELSDLVRQVEECPAVETPETQESIYKTITKRLSLLESNATLSLLYVEEQSKLLSEAFGRLETRQKGRFDQLVYVFNATVHDQLTNLGHMYAAFLVQASSVLRVHEEEHRDMLRGAADRIEYLQKQLNFQHKLCLFNSMLLVMVMIYVAVTREAVMEPLVPYREENEALDLEMKVEMGLEVFHPHLQYSFSSPQRPLLEVLESGSPERLPSPSPVYLTFSKTELWFDPSLKASSRGLASLEVPLTPDQSDTEGEPLPGPVGELSPVQSHSRPRGPTYPDPSGGTVANRWANSWASRSLGEDAAVGGEQARMERPTPRRGPNLQEPKP